MSAVVLWLIQAYRAALRPFFGGGCRFEPSCSHFAEQAIGAHGLWRGSGMAIWRICRCHPFSRGGLDPIPPPATAEGGGSPSGRVEVGGGIAGVGFRTRAD